MRDVLLNGPLDISAWVATGLRDVRFVVAKDAKRPKGPFVFCQDVKGGRVENVEFLDPAGEAEVERFSSGFRFIGCRDLQVRGISASGAGQYGVTVQGGRDITIEGVSTDRCFIGLKVESLWEPTVGLVIRGARLVDGWNPHHDQGSPTPPSVLRPGEHFGWGGFNLHGVVHGRLEQVFTGGETGGSKVTTCRHVVLSGVATPHLSLRGIAQAHPDWHWASAEEGAYDITASRCLIWQRLADASLDASGADVSNVGGYNGVQAATKLRARLVDCDLRGDGRDGHAIQAALDAHVEVEGGRISGWRGARGGVLAAAFDVRPAVDDPSTITHRGVAFGPGQEVWSARTLAAKRD